MSTSNLLEKNLGTFTDEEVSFSLIPWERAHFTEKVLSLNRLISTISTTTEIIRVVSIGLNPFKEYLYNNLIRDSSELQIILGKLMSIIKKIPTPSTPVTSGATHEWLNLYDKLKDFQGFKDICVPVLREKIVNSLSIHTSISQHEIDRIYEKGFQYIAIAECKKKISVPCTKETCKDFEQIFSFTDKYRGQGDEKLFINDIQKLKDTVREKMSLFVNELLSDEKNSLENISYLANKLSGNSTFFGTGLSERIRNAGGHYLNNQIVAGKHWDEIQQIAKDVRVETINYLKMKIAHSNLIVLQQDYQTHVFNGAQLGLLNLLRQEELLFLEIWGAKDCAFLIKLRDKIPAQLPHLYNEVMRQAEKLVK